MRGTWGLGLGVSIVVEDVVMRASKMIVEGSGMRDFIVGDCWNYFRMGCCLVVHFLNAFVKDLVSL